MATTSAQAGKPSTNGVRPPAATADARASQQRTLDKLLAATFGDMVTILMQSPAHKQVPVSELSSRLVPPLLLRQYKMAHAVNQGTGRTQPVALVLWARVSDAVHEQLLASPDAPMVLDRDGWRSGENHWIVDAIGDKRFVAPLLDGLLAKDLAGKFIHCRERTEAGARIRTLGGAKPSA